MVSIGHAFNTFSGVVFIWRGNLWKSEIVDCIGSSGERVLTVVKRALQKGIVLFPLHVSRDWLVTT